MIQVAQRREAKRTAAYWAATSELPLFETTVGAEVRAAAEDSPDAPALIARGSSPESRRCWTYSELAVDALAAARALLGRFDPGERVAIWAPNSPEWLILQLGAALAGMTVVGVNPAYRPDELAYVLGQSRSSGIFFVPEFRGTPMASFLDEVRPRLPGLREAISFEQWPAFVASGSPSERLPSVSPDDPALIEYTSGTTGLPKGAVLHHRGIINSARFTAARYEVSAGERWLNFMPLYYVAGSVISSLGALTSRATQVLCTFEPGLALELIETERCSMLAAGATMLIMLAAHPDAGTRDLSSLRAIGAGGMTAPPQLVARIEKLTGARLGIMFGQTEACGIAIQMHLDDDDEDGLHTLGQPLPHVEVKIAEPGSGAVVACGEPGEICLRGYQVMSGYFDKPEATAAAIDDEGWLHTGDLGSMDERGYCRIGGRIKELINRGAQKFSPREIEEVLESHPQVGGAAVVGIPDAKGGEVGAALIRPAR